MLLNIINQPEFIMPKHNAIFEIPEHELKNHLAAFSPAPRKVPFALVSRC